MSRLYINNTLEKSIRSYCELNGIDDVNAFANRCAMQGFNIVKYGISPKDNMERENNGIKDIEKNVKGKLKQESSPKDEGKQEKVGGAETKVEEEIKPSKESKENVVVRKIRVIKKD